MQLSRSLIKIIDRAIIPALLVFAAKLVGMVVANYYYNLSYDGAATIVPLFEYRSQEAYLMANTFSNLLVLAVIVIGFALMLIRAHLLHGSHISPKLSATLMQKQLTGLIVGSWELYHQAVIWMAFLWLSIILFALQALAGVAPWWLPLSSLAMALVLTWILIADVEKEINLRHELESA